MRKKKLTALDWSQIPTVTPQNTSGYETKKELLARLKAEEEAEARRQQEIADAPIRKLTDEISRNLQAVRDRQRKELFAFPSEYLQEKCTHARQVTDDPQKVAADIAEAFNQFRLQLEREGLLLRPPAKEKLRIILDENPTIDLRSVGNWRIIFEHLNDLAVFTADDLEHRQIEETPEPVETPKPSLDDIERLNLENPAERKKALTIVADLGSEEYAPIFAEWLASLRSNFRLEPTRDQCKQVVSLFHNHGWSFGNPRHYDAARRLMVALKEFPKSALTKDELLSDVIENSDLNDWAEKRTVLSKMQRV